MQQTQLSLMLECTPLATALVRLIEEYAKFSVREFIGHFVSADKPYHAYSNKESRHEIVGVEDFTHGLCDVHVCKQRSAFHLIRKFERFCTPVALCAYCCVRLLHLVWFGVDKHVSLNINAMHANECG